MHSRLIVPFSRPSSHGLPGLCTTTKVANTAVAATAKDKTTATGIAISTPVPVLLLTMILFWLPAMSGSSSASVHAVVTLKDLILLSSPGEDRLLVKLSSAIQPRVQKDLQEDCWLVDLIGVQGPDRVVRKREYSGPVRLFWTEKLSDSPPVQRLYLFVHANTSLKLAQRDPTSFELIIRRDSAVKTEQTNLPALGGRVAMPLIRPHRVHDEVELNISEDSLSDILQDLGQKLGVVPMVLDATPEKITIQARAASPLEALQLLAAHVGLICDVQDGYAWLAHPDNPLWQVSALGTIDGESLSGMSLSQVLPAMTGPQIARRWLDALPSEAREAPLPTFSESGCPRFWVSRFLDAHGVTP